ncbi:MAG: D-glycero-beta-D-manno-heptose 1-phosphate adenylyltransferase [Candidatus Zophobacter franzmannii]|nr:D-glycero-beta-D-manno-heptose 1-phosphate adenylyltransferase [Candidatus Zophobacter franzmannii]
MKIVEKILDRNSVTSTFTNLKDEGKKIVFTNGCFDILHRGHVAYLNQASEEGDILVIGLNSDASVKRLKGEERPINNEQDRAYLLAGLGFVDYVVIFTEDTPFNLIKDIMPNILVKGGDWKPEQIVGSDIVIANGGEVKSLRFEDGYSSTNVIDKMKR